MKLLVLLPLVSAAALVLTGCGETTVEDVRKAYGAMSDEKLQAEALHQRVEGSPRFQCNK